MDMSKPWISIWLRTRETIRESLSETPRLTKMVLVALFGIVFGYDMAVSQELGDKYSLGLILWGSPLTGILNAFIYWLVISWLVYWIGSRLFNGDGDWEETRTAMAWAGVPFIAKLILWIPQWLLFGKDNFTTETPLLDTSVGLSVLFWLFGLLDLILTIWYFVVLSKSIGEVHGISSILGFGIVMLSYLAVILVLVMISLVTFGLLMG
ncbi:Yip1 domain-containing protein [Kroppenstedtia eburnea]|uniref:Yip1 domain-containing protein n=3 Tax=Kroppenstedtia eburnea TaxID=714067 RepID=A0A1N7MVH2_9BACL|nr:hypothetical protein GXN75_00840 [Kroppenstedtia eburnea]SIS89941.1 Yip1 domain-containing protein [Kroppenstedtia eburnea]